MPKGDDFHRSVFLNCPLDEDYDHILQAVLFCLVRFGLKPRIATERSDAGEPRILKILDLIQSSRYSITIFAGVRPTTKVSTTASICLSNWAWTSDAAATARGG